MHSRSRVVVAMVAALVLVGTSTATADVAAKNKKGTALVGLFKIDPTDCATAKVSGSYFRLIYPGGTAEAGPFGEDADSRCADKTYTGVGPVGTDGGLRTGAYQPAPDPPFDAAGNGLGGRILAPGRSHGTAVVVSTNKRGASGTEYPAPKIVASKQGELTGQVEAWLTDTPGFQYENGPTAITGTYDKKSGAYTIEWTAVTKEGPGAGSTNLWHLEGTFVKAKKK